MKKSLWINLQDLKIQGALKALYGLKQAPHAWFEKLTNALHSFGFFSAKSNKSLFIRATSLHLTNNVLVYVDDILITSNDHLVLEQQLVSNLNSKFALKVLGHINKP